MRRAKRQMRGQIYALRLYADDPVLIARAQVRLLLWAARYLASGLVPAAIAAVPLTLLFWQIDGVYGHRVLRAGESAMVSVQLARSDELATARLAGEGIAVETPGVRIPARRQVCWRVRLVSVPARLSLRIPGAVIARTGICSPALRLPAFLTPAPSLAVSCPAASLDIFGLPARWPYVFIAICLAEMLAFRKRFGVTL